MTAEISGVVTRAGGVSVVSAVRRVSGSVSIWVSDRRIALAVAKGRMMWVPAMSATIGTTAFTSDMTRLEAVKTKLKNPDAVPPSIKRFIAIAVYRPVIPFAKGAKGFRSSTTPL